ncbi:MAG TPA: arylesterase, partial [Candidatus Yonathbacteria bacterium]|nr:arylesterase [Candidatus Yonathbacteria bacterium]
MNKWLISIGVIVIVVVVVWVAFGGEKNKITNYPSGGTNIIAFGDSLIEGVGASEGNDFISLLSREIGQPIINVGISGNTTRDGLKRIGKDVLSKDPKIVLISLGGNDYLKRVPKDETFENLENIITQIQNKGAVVLLLGVRGGILRDNYEKNYRDTAERLGAGYVENILDDIIGTPSLMYDALHPN